MIPDWRALDEELSCWSRDGMTLPFWWRDDDAVEPTPQLDRLAALSDQLGLAVQLAVVPEPAHVALADYVRMRPNLVPVVHGWAHHNHAPKDEKKSEFRLHRPIETVLSDARAGLDRLRQVFGPSLRPMFVPPWNRIAAEISAELPALGFRYLSTATPRARRYAAPGLEQVNTHLDPIDWRGSRGLVPPDQLIARLVALLRDRRAGNADNSEPFGFLTHHLVHDDEIWAFSETLMRKMLAGPVRPWIMPETDPPRSCQ